MDLKSRGQKMCRSGVDLSCGYLYPSSRSFFWCFGSFQLGMNYCCGWNWSLLSYVSRLGQLVSGSFTGIVTLCFRRRTAPCTLVWSTLQISILDPDCGYLASCQNRPCSMVFVSHLPRYLLHFYDFRLSCFVCLRVFVTFCCVQK